MKFFKNETNIDKNTIATFFNEDNVKEFIFQKSKSGKITFPWDTKAPVVYKYDDQFIKVHGLKRKSHFFTGKSVSLTISKLHDRLENNGIKTIKPNLIVVNGKYSMVGTINIEKLGLKLLKDVDLETQIETLDNIHKDLSKLKLYHYDNKPENSAIDPKTGEYYLLDIDSVRKRTLRYPNWKLKKRSTQYHNNRIDEFKNILEQLNGDHGIASLR